VKKNKKKKETVAAEPTPTEEAAVQMDEVSSEPSDLPEENIAEETADSAEETPALPESETVVPDSVEETEPVTEPVIEPMKKLRAFPAPFIRTSERVHSLMMDVIIALLPAFLWGVYTFGTRVLTVAVVSVASCVLFEAILQLIRRRPVTIFDLSAVVTGLLLTMGFSSAVPIWMPVVGAFISIVVIKGLFGGLGRNLINPALAARVVLLMWPNALHTFTAPGERLTGIGLPQVESVTTPLDALHNGVFPGVTLSDLILGRTAGCIGEIFPVLLLAGGVYLVVRRVISWRIPVSYIVTVACLAFLFPQIEGANLNYMLCQLFSGGLLLGAIFMATDPVTSPTTPAGHWIYGVGCGVLTILFRYFGFFAEGMPFAILLMNLLTVVIDRFAIPTPFGGKITHERT
jgi:electron transport complex protein RnfD